MVIEVTGVVSDLVDEGRYDFREPVVFLKVHGKIGRRSFPDGAQGFRVLGAVYGHPHDTRTGLAKCLGLRGRGLDVLRLGGAHALDRDGLAAADANPADANAAGLVSRCALTHRDY